MSNWLTQADLAGMIETEYDSLPGYCRIHVATNTTDPAGGDDITYTINEEIYLFDVVPTSDTEFANVSAGREQVVNQHVITLPHDVSVSTRDKIEHIAVDSSGTYESTIAMYEIIDPGDTDPWLTGVEVIAKQVG